VTEKLAKYLARCGVASRRACEEFIRAGWVQVNGQVIRTPETRIDPAAAQIRVRGRSVQPPRTHRYILLNKPAGILCTCQKGREKGRTILDIVRVPERIFPAGRLDRDTAGLLLLTDDGDLVQKLMHPSFEQEREYQIETGRSILQRDLDKLREGIHLEDGLSKFARVQKVGERRLLIILKEGKKRQIRRTLLKIGLPIKNLTRIRLGTLRLTSLPLGKWRDLTPKEISSLRA
jgi:pseudouridine synthase